MKKTLRRESPTPDLAAALRSDCGRCRGLCCSALYFAKSDGFPSDKEAGTPCRHLTGEFLCDVHGELAARGLHGCMAFDCLGAGPRAAAGGGSPSEMAARFPAVRRLYQTLWYLHEILCLLPAEPEWGKAARLISESGWMDPAAAGPTDLDGYEARAKVLLHRAWTLTREAVGQAALVGEGGDFMGKNFKRADLSGADFAMSLLIAADLSGCTLYGTNLLGADMRDAGLQGADLSECVFLTQAQVNGARGDQATRLPAGIRKPESWKGDCA